MATNFPDTSINNPSTGVLWAEGDSYFDPETGLTYYWYPPVWKTGFSPTGATDAKYVKVAGDTMTGDLTVPSLNGGPLAGFRNHIINGDFRIWQRGTSFTTPASATYTADRVSCSNNGGGDWTQTTNVPPSFDYGLSIPAGGIPVFAVELPVVGSAGVFSQGSTWTFSFYSNTNDWQNEAGSAQFAFSTGQATGLNTVILVPFPVTWDIETVGSFYRYTLTFTINALPNADNNCLRIYLRTASASVITGVQLEPGPVATPFEHRPYGTELALCQRYYEVGYSSILAARIDTGAGYFFNKWTHPFKVSKRVVPTTTTDMNSGNIFAPWGGTLEELLCSGYVFNSPNDNTPIDGTFTADAEL
jgi:hypothetical protein